MEAIFAINRLGAIGLNNKLPWRSKSDLKHFRKLTDGKKLLVGRTTFESLPKLPNRELIVVGSGYNTLEEALSKNPDMVIGGKKLFDSTKKYVDKIHLSIINNTTSGDVGYTGIECWSIVADKRTVIYEFDED